MQERSRLMTSAPVRRARRGGLREQEELALLAEFMRHGTVAALAGAIAARLGEDARQADLIARADLGPGRDSR